MSDISNQVGGSKATLYGYFQSKEQLFAAALEEMIGEQAEVIFAAVASEEELEVRLITFAHSYLEARMSSDALEIERALISEGKRSDLGERLRMRFIEPHWRQLASVLDQEMQAGRLRKADPKLAAKHFRALIEVDLIERLLHGDTAITAHETEIAANAGVDTFLRAYAV
jgi:AcrR family transcriptional regulator